MFVGGLPMHAQGCGAAALAVPARNWLAESARFELQIIDNDGNFPLRYRIRKVDAKGDTMRDVIESRDGTVARLVQRDGRPLTPAEDAAERDRLNGLLGSPSDFARHAKHDLASRKLSMELVRDLPGTMLVSYAPGQPQLPGRAPQAVIDYAPDPAYKPPAMRDQVFTGIAGRIWIDCEAKRMARIQAHILQPVELGWGLVAKIYPGGDLELEQSPVGSDRWAYSSVREDITVRAMLVKTIRQNARMDAGFFQLLPAPVSYQEAIRTLLATPLPR